MKFEAKSVRIALSAVMIAFCGVSQAEGVSGVLEKGREHSAIFSLSPESGDLIGYFVKANSPQANKLDGVCLIEMVCELEGASVREHSGDEPEGFEDVPVAWFEITAFKVGGVGVADLDWQSEVQTQFGRVHVDEESSSLYFEGKPVQPVVEANSGLSIIMHYEVTDADVLLLQNTGGTACPALYRYVVVTNEGVNASPEFGTCSEVMYPTFDGNSVFSVNMIGFAGPDEAEKVQRQAVRTKHRFDYNRATGVILENGKNLK